MPETSLRRRARAVLGVLVAVVLYFAATFALTGGFCLFKGILGLPCPGCGMTRAVLSLLQLDLPGALRWHPGIVLVPPAALLLLFHRSRAAKIGLGVLCALYVALYALRMAALFPTAAPLDFNAAAPLAPLVARLLGLPL